MARLATTGFEAQALSATAATDPEGLSIATTGTVTINTATPRSGAACASMAAAATAAYVTVPFTGVLDRAYYARIAIRINAAPTGSTGIVDWRAGAGLAGNVTVGTDRKVSVRNSAQAIIQTCQTVLSVDTWYVLELKMMVPTAGNGTLASRLDGSQWMLDTAANVGNVALTALRTGHNAASADSMNVLIDDVAINDDQGSDQNYFPGTGKVVLLKPTGDNTVTGWGVG